MATAVSVYLPPSVQKNAVGKFIDETNIQMGDTGFEIRKRRVPLPRRAWTVGWLPEDVATVEAMYEALGRTYSFLFAPPRVADYEETDQPALNTVTGTTTGDGATATFQLMITRTVGSISGSKYIKHPRTGTVAMTVDGSPETHFTVSLTTGIVTFAGGFIPAAGKEVTADFEYDTPVRFDSAELSTTIQLVPEDNSTIIQSINQASIIEVFNE